MLLDEEFHKWRVALHRCVVQTRPSHLGLTIDERVPGEQRLANLDAAVLGRQVERGLSLVIEHVDTTVVLEKYLRTTPV